MTPENARASLRFSTDGLPEVARQGGARTLRAHKLARQDRAARAAAELYRPRGHYQAGAAGPWRHVRHALRTAPSCPAKGVGLQRRGRSLLAVNLSGHSTAQQRGRELILQDGDAVLGTRSSTGFTITRLTPVRFIGFRVPREAIAPLVGRLDDAPLWVVPYGSGPLNLLVTYAGAIADEQLVRTPELQRLVVTHIHDLIAAIIGATRDGRAIAEERGIRAARLRAVMADITANLGDCDLTVAAIARRQRVTPR